jgi:hypothetical protein
MMNPASKEVDPGIGLPIEGRDAGGRCGPFLGLTTRYGKYDT